MNRRMPHQVILETRLWASTLILAMLLIISPGCKKLDIVRKIKVLTYPVETVYSDAVIARGAIIDLGPGILDDHGFIVSSGTSGIIVKSLGSASITGDFSTTITGLNPSTAYTLRSFAQNSSETVYGEEIQFTTSSASTFLLYYDNGTNFSGVNYQGSNFDVGIRFTAAQLQPYAGMRITHIRFYPRSSLATYALEIYKGTSLVMFQPLTTASLQINAWNNVALNTPYLISGNDALIIGYWVHSYPVTEYPAGIDAGPAIAGSGDLISGDNGVTWQSLFLNYAINGNWNIRVTVSSSDGKSTTIENTAGSCCQKPHFPAIAKQSYPEVDPLNR